MTYELGGVAALTFTAVDTAGAAANATSCTITVTRPDGTLVGPTVLTGTAGVYTYYFVTAQPGRHSYRFLATGTPGPGVGVGAYADVFNVNPATSDAIVSLADAKTLLRKTDTTHDDDIRAFISSITRFVNKYCGTVAPVQVTERLDVGGGRVMLRRPPVYQPAGQAYPLISFTPVHTYGVVYDLSQLSVDLTNGEIVHTIGLPFFLGPYDATYWSGRIAPTANIQLAVEIMLKHMWALERNNGRPSATTPGAADDVTMLYGFAIPNRALELLEPDRTPAGMA